MSQELGRLIAILILGVFVIIPIVLFFLMVNSKWYKKYCEKLAKNNIAKQNLTPSSVAIQKNIICPNPNCGYKGIGIAKSKADTGAGLLLLLFFVIPGILYFLFASGCHYNCPKCGMRAASD